MSKENELVSFVRGFARWAHENRRENVPLCMLDALLSEYDKVCGRLEKTRAVRRQVLTDKAIVDSLLDQAMDKTTFIRDDDPDCIFQQDVEVLLAAVNRLREYARQDKEGKKK